MRATVFIGAGTLLLGGFAASQAGYLDWVWPQGSGTRLVADNTTAQSQDTAPSQPAAGTPSSAGPASQPVSAAAPPRNSVKVDESALRYFAAKGDTKRLDAEIARLRALYPQWTPPANPLAVQNTDDPQLDGMWKLYSDGKLTDLRKAIADRQTAEPGWQAPADLLDRLAVAESREQLVNASNLKQYDAVIRIGSVTPSLLTCGDVDVLWRVAEAFAKTQRPDRAKDAYGYVLKNCDNPQERMATLQKALPLLARAPIDDLLALERKGADGKGEFDSIRGDIARQSMANADADSKLTVADDDIARVQKLASDGGLVSDDLLLGWYYVRRDKAQDAETWFRKAHDKEDTAATAEGLALALVNLGRPADAEDVLYKWRETSDDVRKVYLAAVANLLAITPPQPLDPAVLQRMSQEVAGAKDAASAQQFGWYADGLNQVQTAAQWFQLALDWKPDDEPSAYGLALALWKLGDKAGVKQIQNAWAGRSERIPTVGLPSVETSALGNRAGVRQPTGEVAPQPQTYVAPQPQTYVAPQSQAYVAPQPQIYAEPAPAAGPAQVERQAGRPAARPRRAAAPSGCSSTLDPAGLAPEQALTRGWCLMQANRPVEAAAAFEVALRGTGKTQSDAAYGQSLAYMRAGLTDMAAVSATKAPLDSNRRVEIKTALLESQATTAYNRGRYNETILALDERSRIAPERTGLMVLRAYAYMRLKRYDDAEQLFRAAAATGSHDALVGLNSVMEAKR